MSIVQELKRRNVFRVAVAYVVAAWVIIEISSLILEIYETPDSVIRIVVALLTLGLPFAIVFAWAFEVTPEGIKRESEVDRSHSVTHVTAKRLDLLTIGLVVLAVSLFSADRFMPNLFGSSTVASLGTTDTGRDVLWATRQLVEIDRLRDLGEYGAAFSVATEAEPLLSDDVTAEDLWSGFSWASDINSAPTGARVYRQPIDAMEDDWQDLGETPLNSVRFARQEGYRLRFELEGHRTVELLQTAIQQDTHRDAEVVKPVRLDPIDVLPEEMLRISGFTHDLVDYDDYFMDRFEVSNREYQRFVNAGGYETSAFWTNKFVREGKEVDWQEAVREFVDRTGQTGPSTWSGGAYPEGLGDHPVGGLSWYEAAAYARYVNKELPSRVHHDMARRFYGRDGWLIAPRSNLGGSGSRPVGENRAMTTLGVFDLIGNVREWCWNEVGTGTRGTAGAAWTDSTFHADWFIPKSPWDRDSTHGFRLMRTFDDDQKLARLRQQEQPVKRRDFWTEEPVSDAEFAIYKRMYAYDPQPLNAEVIAEDTFEHWTRQRVEFDLPYGERGGAFIYVPNSTDSSYQTVIYWPGSGALLFQSVDEDRVSAFDFLVRSGRAVVEPIFKGTFDRDDNITFDLADQVVWVDLDGTNYRDLQIKWVQEMSRTIDYMETRDDLDTGRLGFYGISWGGLAVPIALAVDDRFATAVVLSGGLDDINHFLPEVEPFNFVPRVRTPFLLLNGEYDMIYPLETSQKPMFEMLGTDSDHKRHVVTPASHRVPKDVSIRETLNWFDRYLGEHKN